MKPSTSIQWAGLAVLMYIIGLWSLLLWGGASESAVTLAELAAPVVTTVLAVWAAVRQRGILRNFWGLISLGAGFYAAGQSIWCYYYSTGADVSVPAAGAADILWNMQTAFFVLALYYIMYKQVSAVRGMRFLFDTTIMMLVFGTLGWEFIVGPNLAMMVNDPDWILIMSGVLYPASDLGLVMGLLMLHFEHLSLFSSRVMRLFTYGFIAFVIGDVLYFFDILAGTYTVGRWYDPFWSVGLLLCGLAAMYGRGEEEGSASAEHGAGREARSKRLRYLSPYCGLVLLCCLMVQRVNAVDGLVIGTILVILLIVVRQISILFENEGLVARLKDMLNRSEYQALHDELSGLPNKRMFERRLSSAVEESAAGGGKLAVLFMDLDRFKYINDSLGHAIGDELIRQVGLRIAEIVAGRGLVARLGGDEFTILFIGWREKEEVEELSTLLLHRIAAAYKVEIHEILTTTSIGIALYPEDGNSGSELMKHADAAMYKAKELGKGRIQFFEPAFNGEILKRVALEHALRHALSRGELHLHYQPQVCTKTEEIMGAEALLRWKLEDGSQISPAEFIPLAEETGLIVPIGEWVLRTACRQAAQWDRMGLPPLKVAVNVSPKQLVQNLFVQRVASILEETGVQPERLVIEITEGIALLNTAETTDTLIGLKKLGIQISMDDFGTGYSSLGYLRTFQVDSLKIAQSFISRITVGAEHEGIVRAIMAMAGSMHLEVIVEGVETEGQLRLLKGIAECLVQGYYFYKPLPPQELTAILRKQAGWKG
ncbi:MULTISPECIES: putative bifunctional diguanylate cyclase/phosphodiesterase [Paenibacillus]|uniref:putative bifunctional diguanylate cyclase/phosphodiesterase n=1 Tax=Paenibacillus TaxID=44249 RepID=UPI0022B87FD5|nr:EAL domain-containing protein [Paenibacillus caseinilyticus]MCZ8522559.1 EAL domain-containing protein [Paenibacillus caseinilyticus]